MMKQRALFIGGTGTISIAITAALAAEGKWDLTLLNRGNRPEAVPDGVRVIRADIRDEAQVAELLEGTSWDCVCDFIGFVPAEVERDCRISGGRPGSISSAASRPTGLLETLQAHSSPRQTRIAWRIGLGLVCWPTSPHPFL